MSLDEYAEDEVFNLEEATVRSFDDTLINGQVIKGSKHSVINSIAPPADVAQYNDNSSNAFITEIGCQIASTSPRTICPPGSSGVNNFDFVSFNSESEDPLLLKVIINDSTFKLLSFPSEYICQICLEPFRKPMRFSHCAHVFCTDCVYYLFALWGKTCPVCNDRSNIYNPSSMFPGIHYVQYNPFITLIDEDLEMKICRHIGITPYTPIPGDIVRILAPRELYQFTMISAYCGIVQDITDGVISEDLTRILDKETVDNMSINERYKINALHSCRVVRVNCYGILWIGRLCEIEPLRANVFTLGTRIVYGSPVIETAKLPERLLRNMHSLFTVRDFAIQERELFTERNYQRKSCTNSLVNLTRDALEYLNECNFVENVCHSASKEFAIFKKRQQKWNVDVPYHPDWPKFAPLALIVKTNLYNNMDVLYRYKLKLRQMKSQQPLSRTLKDIINLNSKQSSIQQSILPQDFSVASLVMSTSSSIKIEVYLVKQTLISFDSTPTFGFTSSEQCDVLNPAKTQPQCLNLIASTTSQVHQIATPTRLNNHEPSVSNVGLTPQIIQVNLLNVSEDSDETLDIEEFKQQVLPLNQLESESGGKYSSEASRHSSQAWKLSHRQSLLSTHSLARNSEGLISSQLATNVDISQKTLGTVRRPRAKRWPEALTEQNSLIDAASRRNIFDRDKDSVLQHSRAAIGDQLEHFYNQNYSTPYKNTRPTLLSTNLTYCYPSHLRKFLRIITDFTTWYTYKEFCCSGCRMLLRFPVKALCGHFYCYNCYMDCRENNWVCFDCGQIMDHVKPCEHTDLDIDPYEKTRRKSTYIYGSQVPLIDWKKVCIMRKRLPWFNCLIDCGFPCVIRGHSRTKIGILLDDPSQIYCHILFGNRQVEVHNINTIASINVFDLRPALRYGDGITLTQSRNSSLFNFGLCNITTSYLYTDSTIFCGTRYSSEVFVMGLNMSVMAHKTLRLVEDLEPKLISARREGLQKQIDEEQKDFLEVWAWCQYERDTAKQQYEMLLYGVSGQEAKVRSRPSFLTEHFPKPPSPGSRSGSTMFVRKVFGRKAPANPSPIGAKLSTESLLFIEGHCPNISLKPHQCITTHHKNYNPQTSIITFQYRHQLRPKRAPTATAYCSKHPLVDPNYRNKLIIKDERILMHRKDFIHWYFNQIEMNPGNRPISGIDIAHAHQLTTGTKRYSLLVENRLAKYDSIPHLDTQLEQTIKAEERNQYIIRSLCDVCYRFPCLEFLCSSCHCVLRRPVRLVCTHIVCRTCACIHLASEIPCLACGTPVTDISKVRYETDLEDQIIHAVNHMFYTPKYDVGVIVQSISSSNMGMIVSMAYLRGTHYAYVAFFGTIKLCKCSDLIILEPDWKALDFTKILAPSSLEPLAAPLRLSSFHHQIGSFFTNPSVTLGTFDQTKKIITLPRSNIISGLSKLQQAGVGLALSAIESIDEAELPSSNMKSLLLKDQVDPQTIALLSVIGTISTTGSTITSSKRSKSASTPFSNTRTQHLSGISSSTTDGTMFLSLPTISEQRLVDEKSMLLDINPKLSSTFNNKVSGKVQLESMQGSHEQMSSIGNSFLELNDSQITSQPNSHAKITQHPENAHPYMQPIDLHHDQRLLTSPRESIQQDDVLSSNIDSKLYQSINYNLIISQHLSSSINSFPRSWTFKDFTAFTLRRTKSAPELRGKSSYVANLKDPKSQPNNPSTEFLRVDQLSALSSTQPQGNNDYENSIHYYKENDIDTDNLPKFQYLTRSSCLSGDIFNEKIETDIGLPFINGVRVTKLRPYFYISRDSSRTHSVKTYGASNIRRMDGSYTQQDLTMDNILGLRDSSNKLSQYPQLGDVFVVVNGPYKGLLGLTQSYAKTYSTFKLSYYCLLETGTAHEFPIVDLQRITLLPAANIISIRKQLTEAKGQNENKNKLHWYNLIMDHGITTAEKFAKKKQLFNLQAPDEILLLLQNKEVNIKETASSIINSSKFDEVTVSPMANINTLLNKKIVIRYNDSKEQRRTKSCNIYPSASQSTPQAFSTQLSALHSSAKPIIDEMLSPLFRSFSVRTSNHTSLLQEFNSPRCNTSTIQHLNMNVSSNLPKLIVQN